MKPIFVLGFWFKPSIKGIWYVDGRAHAVLINARKRQPLDVATLRFLTRGIYELHCIDDPNDPVPLIVDLSEHHLGAGRELHVHALPVERAVSLDVFDASLRQFVAALTAAGVALPAPADLESLVTLFKR